MIDTVVSRFEGMPIKAVIGGFHLIGLKPFSKMAGSRADVTALARKTLEFPVRVAYTGHCTGAKGYSVLKETMGDRLQPIRTGTVLEL